MSESEILASVLLALGSRSDVRCWRNGSGMARYGERVVRFGVVGGADILGVIRLSIAGREIGALLCVECKTLVGRQSEQQRRFEAMVRAFGGCYVLARSVEDAVAGVDRFIQEHSLV